jgi:ribosomal protein S18 acetylase RimI-like enzyme
MEFTIRKAERKDAEAIAHVHVESWRSTYAEILPATFLGSIDSGARARLWQEQIAAGTSIILVAESSGGIVGFVSGGRSRETMEGCDAELYAIYMLCEYQGRGLGRALVCALVDSLREEGYRAMLVLVLEKNPAVSFYARLGGTQIARKPIEIGGVWLDELVFAWFDIDAIVKAK